MKVVVELALIDQLGVISIDRLDFDSNLKVGPCVDSLVNLPKRSFVYFPEDFKVLANFLQHLWHCKQFE